MSKVDVLSFRQLDEQTIEHTDTLQSYSAYMYTFVADDVKLTKNIITPHRGNKLISNWQFHWLIVFFDLHENLYFITSPEKGVAEW